MSIIQHCKNKPGFVSAVMLFVLVSGSVARAQSAGARYILQVNGTFPSDVSQIVTNAGGTLNWVHNETGVASATSSNPQFAANLLNTQVFTDVTEDEVVQMIPPGETGLPVNPGAIPDLSSPNPTSAADFSQQWGMVKVNAPGAWQMGFFGSPNVEVAVIDSGIGNDQGEPPHRQDSKETTLRTCRTGLMSHQAKAL